MSRAALIAFEGIDGAGKTTQLGHLEQNLRSAGMSVKTIRPLSRGMPFFVDVEAVFDRMPRETYCNMVAFERLRRIRQLVERFGRDFDVLLCDRYMFSDYAYAIAYGCDIGFIEDLCLVAERPVLTVLCDAPVDVAMQRIMARSAVLEFQENASVLSGARRAYLDLSRTNANFATFDTACRADQVAAAILAAAMSSVAGSSGAFVDSERTR